MFSFSFNTAKTGKIVTEDGSDRLAVLKESGESQLPILRKGLVLHLILIRTTFALPCQCFALVFQIAWATTTTLLGRRLAIQAAGMASHTSEGETIKLLLSFS